MNRTQGLKTYFKKDKNGKRKPYFSQIKYPRISAGAATIPYTTKVGDRLDNIANIFYEDPTMWWAITLANPNVLKRDNLYPKPGIEIQIPIDVESIRQGYSTLNDKSFN